MNFQKFSEKVYKYLSNRYLDIKYLPSMNSIFNLRFENLKVHEVSKIYYLRFLMSDHLMI